MSKLSNKKYLILMLILGLGIKISSLYAQQSSAIELYHQGKKEQLQINYYKAIELYKSATEKNPKYIPPLKGLAECYFLLEEYQQAYVFIEQARTLDFFDINLKILEGQIQIGMKQIDKAKSLFNEVLEQEPYNVEARLGLAELQIAEGEQRNAIDTYLESIKIAPTNRQALLSLTSLYHSLGEKEIANTYLSRALMYHSNNQKVQYLAGKYYFENGNLKKAEHHIRTALNLNPEYEDAILLLITIYIHEKNFTNALSLSEKLIEINTGNTIAWYTKGLAQMHLDKTEETIQSYHKAISIRPDDEISRFALEEYIQNTLQPEDKRRNQYAEYHYNKAIKYKKHNLLRDAYREARRTVYLNPFSGKGRLVYAKTLNTLGYQSKFLRELHVIKNNGYVTTEINDLIEIYSSLLQNSVSNSWNVDQFIVGRNKSSIFLFHEIGKHDLLHPLAGDFLVQYLRYIFNKNENIKIEGQKLSVDSYSQAFSLAREHNCELFILFRFSEAKRVFSIEANVYLGRTGSLVDTFEIFRSGNQRVTKSLHTISDKIMNALPIRGKIIQREFKNAIINLGKADGIKQNDKFSIIKTGDLTLKSNALDYTIRESDIIGELEVIRTDDLVSETKIEIKGFYDMINVGDIIIKKSETDKE